MRRCLPALALALAGCGKTADGTSIAAVPVPTAAAGLTAPIYQSGSRLKLRWAEPVGEGASVRLPLGIFDAQLGRECVLEYDAGDVACLPAADLDAGFDDIAFLGAEETEPALLVEDEACSARAGRDADPRIWELPSHRGKTPNRYVLGEARSVRRLWEATGSGCTPTYEERRRRRCVRPFRPADLRDVVRAKETRFGREGDPSGVLVAVGTDGSVLPLHLGADYVDAANDLRCSVDADACVPRWPDGLDVTPTVGADLLVSNTSGHWSKWGHRYGEDVWAALTPPSPGKRVPQIRGVLALLTPAQALHFAPLTVGQGRIVLRGKTMPDGRRVPLSLHDTQLRRDCAPTQVDDGTWRCTVQLPWTCQRTRVGEGQALTEAITPSSSFGRDLETSCQGGPIWSPRIPARGPRRFNIDPDLSYHPAVPGRAARFSETPRMADHLEGWQPQFRRPVYDQIEELGPEVFAELRIVQDL